MRRLMLAVTLLVAASFASDTLLTQNFNGNWRTNNPPPGWRIFRMPGGPMGRGDWNRDSGLAPWNYHPSAFAGIYPQNGMDPTPDSLISPLIDCRHHINVALRCSTNFIGGPNAYQAQVIYSIDGGATYPYVARDYHGDSTGTIYESIALPQAQDQANVKICWVFYGDLNNITSWFMDDLNVLGDFHPNSILMTQDFNGNWSTNNPPPGWRIFHTQPPDSGPDDWHRDTAYTYPWNGHPSAFAAIQPSLNPDPTPDSLISPIINCSAYQNIVLTCSTYFWHGPDQPYTAKLVYSTDGGATWPYTLHDYYLNHPVDTPYNFAETLNLDNAKGKANVRLAWVFNGDLNFINRWFVDDVVVYAESIVNWDVACESIAYPTSRVPPGMLAPSAIFGNLGSNLQTNVPVRCSLYTDQMVGLNYWTSTIGSLLPDSGQQLVTFTPAYNLSVGNYFIKFWSRADSDQVRGNDTLYTYFEGSPLRGLSYDDGTPATYQSYPVGHNGWGVKFDADTSPVYIESLYAYLEAPATASFCGYQLAIFLDDGSGHPGKLYFKTPVQYATPGINGWNSVYLGSAGNELVMPSGPFYVFYLQVGEPPECPALGRDAGRNPLASYWKYQSGVMIPDSSPGDYMIRAVVNMTPVNHAPVDLRTLYVDQPLYDFVQRPFDAPITPKALVENFGSGTVAPLSVECDIIGTVGGLYYTNVQTIASLAPGQDTLVTFANWTPTQAERCTVVVKTLVNGNPDPVPQNDEKRFAVDVLKGAHTGVSTLQYHWIDSDTTGGPTYAWIDTNGFGNVGALGDNNGINIPFEPGMYFPFYDSTYSYVWVNSNGWVGFGTNSPGGDNDTFPVKIPAPTVPNRCIYAWWDNLAIGSPWGHGSVRYKWFGVEPNRYMVVVFQDVTRVGADTSKGITFELIFRENGLITVQYKSVETGDLTFDNARNATIGLENKDGSDGLCYLYSRPPLSTSVNGLANRLSPGRAIMFYPNRRDAAMIAIIKPATTEFPGVITPTAKIQNYGTVPDTMRVFMTIGSTYAHDTLVQPLQPGDSATVELAPWTAQMGSYPVCCSVHMAGDVNASNNAITEMINAAAWRNLADIPPTYRKRRVQSGALCYAPTTNKLYALKGSNTNDFWEYDIAGDSWDSLASIPTGPYGAKARDGAHLTFDPDHGAQGRIWAIKGGGRPDFYYYDIAKDSWYSKRDMIVTYMGWPYSNRGYKPPKVGAAIEYVAASGTQGSVYAIPGNRTNYFWRYDIAKDSWYYPHDSTYTAFNGVPFWLYVPLDVPTGPLGVRCKYGSDLAFLNSTNMLYVLKGSGTVEAYGFSFLRNAWSETLDMNSFLGHYLKRVKAGGSLVANDDRLYALKGGNTQEFWHYNFTRKLWLQSSDIPFAAPPGRRVKVKGGSAMASDDSVIFCLKGSNTYEFWEYSTGADTYPLIAGYQPEREGVMAEQTALDLSKPWLTVYPNPTPAGLSISYNIVSGAPTHLRVYDASGKLVATLWDATRSRGHYVTQWSGMAGNGRQIAAGVYFLKLESGDTRLTQKLIIQR